MKGETITCDECGEFEFTKKYSGEEGTRGEREYERIQFSMCPVCGAELADATSPHEEDGGVKSIDDKRCPRCDSEVEPTIDYTHGHRTTDGWGCTECNWWCPFGDAPWGATDE